MFAVSAARPRCVAHGGGDCCAWYWHGKDACKPCCFRATEVEARALRIVQLCFKNEKRLHAHMWTQKRI